MKDLRADVAAVSLPAPGRGTVADFVGLTKPRLNLLVVATSAAGYYLGAAAAPDLIAMAEAVAGTAFVAGGASVLNQVYERDTDALMRRTRMRPLPMRGAVCCSPTTSSAVPVRPGRTLRMSGMEGPDGSAAPLFLKTRRKAQAAGSLRRSRRSPASAPSGVRPQETKRVPNFADGRGIYRWRKKERQ